MSSFPLSLHAMSTILLRNGFLMVRSGRCMAVSQILIRWSCEHSATQWQYSGRGGKLRGEVEPFSAPGSAASISLRICKRRRESGLKVTGEKHTATTGALWPTR